MAKRELDSILEAEAQAALVIEEAKRKARDIVLSAEHEAENIMRNQEKNTRSVVETLLSEARKERDAHVSQTVSKSQSETESIRNLAASRVKDAVGIVIEQVKEAL